MVGLVSTGRCSPSLFEFLEHTVVHLIRPLERRVGIHVVPPIHFGKVSVYGSNETLVAAFLISTIVLTSHANIAFAEGLITVVLAARAEVDRNTNAGQIVLEHFHPPFGGVCSTFHHPVL